MNHIKYQDGYKNQLYETYVHRLLNKLNPEKPVLNRFLELNDGILTIREGYAWDGASGPTFDTPSFRRGALVHDALYQLIREGCLPRSDKAAADNELRDLCILDGMSLLRAWYVHRAVSRFGTSSTIRNRQIIIAP